MTQAIERAQAGALGTQYESALPERLDPYGEGGIAAQAGRITPLAIVSLGFRQAPREDGALGLPRASRRDDERWLHLHDPEGRAPGLKAALEEGKYRRLQIAFPSDRGFIQQSFTRWTASALEIYGDATGLHLIDGRDAKNPVHKFVKADSADFARLVKTCKAETRILFTLARWIPAEADGDLPSAELSFADGFGVYVFRTAGRHTAQNIFGYLEQISGFTGGRIAGIPFDLEVSFPEVIGPDGKKRMVATASIVMRPPERIKLNSRTFRQFATAGLEEGRNLQLPALPSPDELALEGPPDIEEVPEDAVQRLAAGDFPCDYNLTVRTWHAIVRGTPLEADENRARWLREWSTAQCDAPFESLTAFRNLTQREATQMLADLADGVSDVRGELERVRQAENAAVYDRIFEEGDSTKESRKGGALNNRPKDQAPDTVVAGPSRIADPKAETSTVAEADQPAMIKTARHPMMSRLATLLETAAQMDIDASAYHVRLPAPQIDIETKLQQLGAEISAVRRQVAGEPDDDMEQVSAF